MKITHATDLALALAHVAETLDEHGVDTVQLRVCEHRCDDRGDHGSMVVMAGVRCATIDPVLDALEALGVPPNTVEVQTMPGLSGRLLTGIGTTASGRTTIGLAWVATEDLL
jgi:hypothetical protein